jgi:tetratricopeptide (TPR) repeat protein
MPLTRREKNFINKNFPNLSIDKISQVLKINSSEIEKYVNEYLSNRIKTKKTDDSTEYKTFKHILIENIGFFSIIFIFLLLLYSRSLDAILLSDENQVFNNNFLTGQMTLFGSLNTIFFQYINFSLFGLNGGVMRFTSLILHFINMLLFFYLFRNFFGEKVVKIALLIFASHSLIVEPITWVAAQPYIFMAFLYLLSIIFSFQFWRTNKIYYYILSVLFIVILTLSGGHTNFAPLFLIAFNLFILKRPILHEIKYSAWLLLLIPVYTLMNRGTVEARIASLTTGPYLPKYLQTLPFTVAKSFELVVFPYNLALFHEETLYPEYFTFARIFTVFCIFFTIYLFFKNKKFFGVLALALTNVIYIFSPIQIAWFVAERYMYFSVLIFCLFFGIFAVYLEKKYGKYLALILVSVFFLFFTFRSFTRFEDWKTFTRLWEANAITSPDSYRVRNNLAESYLKEQKFVEAEKQFLEAIRINPNFGEAYINLSQAKTSLGKLDEAELALQQALSLDPALVEGYLQLAILYANSGRFDLSYGILERGQSILPNDPKFEEIRQQIINYEATYKKN